MDLLERTPQLEEMQSLFQEAAGGSGCLLLLGGEAGVGKTALVQRFCQVVRSRATVLTGACDTLSTPRPLGPLLDVAPSLGDPVRTLLASGTSRHSLYSAVLAALAAKSRPVVLVIEDAHWADEATLDLVRYLARRVAPVRCMMIVTYRDDEVGSRHPLQVVLGDVATAGSVRRLSLPVLSPDAVSRLARGTPLDPVELYRLTGGNPFHVTEVIALGQPGLPQTVRDAVLARVARLPAAAREVVDVAAAIGGLIDERLLARAAGDDAPGIDLAVEAGLLQARGHSLEFRHELARQAVHDALLPIRRRALHQRVLAALVAADNPHVDLATLAHHAEGAGDPAAVLEYAPAAAREASSRRAHREAAAQYARALRFAAALAPERRAALLQAYAYECYVSDRSRDGIEALLEARDIWHRAGDSLREGESERWLSRLYWVVGQNADAEAAADAAIRILEPCSAGHELAMAYSGRSQLRMLANDFPAALHWGERALALADRIADTEAMIHALNNVGTAKLLRGDPDGANLLTRSLEMARDRQLEDHAARAYTNLGSTFSDFYAFREAERYLTEGIAYCVEHDCDFLRLYMTARQALVRCFQGRWADALQLANIVLETPNIAAVTRIMALVALGRTRSRRGDPDGAPGLDEALALALATGEDQRIGPARAARAEAAWLVGDIDRVRAEAERGMEEATLIQSPWLIGEFGLLLHSTGDLREPPAGAAQPFVHEIEGDWAAAATAWEALGCPYEAARARMAGRDEPTLRQALREFQRLGARPAEASTRRRLMELGARHVPRGHRPSTRAHAAMLTAREIDVLALMATGSTNAEIAARLYLSPKTVEFHATSIFHKLEVSSRKEAVRVASRHGLLS